MWGETSKYQPFRDSDERVIEDEESYARRMKADVLPDWPKEVLIEWLHRHADFIWKYVYLGFETFSFSNERWPLEKIPSREAFDDEEFCDAFSNVEERASDPYDWLAQHMLEQGTWNTPIILLQNERGQHTFPGGEPLKRPFHLLEGHRRLSFLNGLRKIGKAFPYHDVWVVRI
ncbi:MAG: hypothetical protein KME45_19950 [Stenomitos rutilans HA7619-LM2]|nr:hypothetical protein [Stenomitos rutilans HA7619-LM2]